MISEIYSKYIKYLKETEQNTHELHFQRKILRSEKIYTKK